MDSRYVLGPPFQEAGEYQESRRSVLPEVQETGDGRVNIRYIRPQSPPESPIQPTEPWRGERTASQRPIGPESDHFGIRLNIALQVVGSQGDIQPFIALGLELRRFGHRVRLCTHATFRDLVMGHGLEFFCIGGDPAELMAYMVRNPGLIPSLRSVRSGSVSKHRRIISSILDGCWRACFEPGTGLQTDQRSYESPGSIEQTSSGPFAADLIIANPPSLAHIHCAEKLGIPLIMAFTMPWSPTRAFAHPLANVQSRTDKPSFAHLLSYTVVEFIIWQGLGDLINTFRQKTLGLDRLDITRAVNLVHELQIPHVYLWSPALLPKPDDWPDYINICGFTHLPVPTKFVPSVELNVFLDQGPPPIYVGFGSIVVDDAAVLSKIVFKAIELTGQRAIIGRGWAHLGEDNHVQSEDIFLVDQVPHEWLFRHVSCVVHHGGAGTTATGLLLGLPTVIVPFFGDQPFWGAVVASSGAGPAPVPYRSLTAEKLAAAIRMALEPSVKERALAISEEMQKETAAESAARCVHHYLSQKHLACSLYPALPAVWRIKRSSVILSGLAAAVLCEAKQIKRADVEMYRSEVYDSIRNPHEPVRAGTQVLMGSVGRIFHGLWIVAPKSVEAMRMRIIGGNRAPARSPQNQQQCDSSALCSRDLECSIAKTSPKSKSKVDRLLDPLHQLIKTNRVLAQRASLRTLDLLLLIPMDLTLSFSRGFHNAHILLYHDGTVPPVPRVINLRTGCKAARTEIKYGLVDGITDICSQPCSDWNETGPKKALKGAGKGALGLFLRLPAGLFGAVGYPLNGLHQTIQDALFFGQNGCIMAARIAQGIEQMRGLPAAQRAEILAKWQELQKKMY
ncbi:hypothetical protein BJX96DRAFT_167274 [Aspergillus floccosus]